MQDGSKCYGGLIMMDSDLYAILEEDLLTDAIKGKARRIATSMQIPPQQLSDDDLKGELIAAALTVMPELSAAPPKGLTREEKEDWIFDRADEAKEKLLPFGTLSPEWDKKLKQGLKGLGLIPQKTIEGTRATTIAPAGTLTASGRARPEERQETVTVSGETVVQSKEDIEAMNSRLACYLEIGAQNGSWARWLHGRNLEDIALNIERNIKRLAQVIEVYTEAKKLNKQVMQAEAIEGDDFSLMQFVVSNKDATEASRRKEQAALDSLQNMQMPRELNNRALIRRILQQPLVKPVVPEALAEAAVNRALVRCMGVKMSRDNPRQTKRRLRRRKRRRRG